MNKNKKIKDITSTNKIPTEKLARKKFLEEQRKIKPVECLKYIRVLIDPEILSGEVGGCNVLSSLVNLGVKYEIRPQKVARIIQWERVEEPCTDLEERMSLHRIPQNHIIHVVTGKDIIKTIKNNSLDPYVSDLKEKFKDKKITLFIFGLKNFCRSNKSIITRIEIERSLTEIQIIHNCLHRLHENSEEMAANISQFTKAIAEIPFKKQKAEKYFGLNCYLLNDNKDCVRVDGINGLSRLWQQHLTRLPLVTLETAEAIMEKYPTPAQLFEEYENSEDGANLLADLKIRRAGGPLASVRRIGPELSRKIHNLYTSLDPSEKL